jgi:hypothetical protein
MSDRLHAVGRATCERRGYEVTIPDQPWLPTALANPGSDTDPFVPQATNTVVAIESLEPTEVTPTMVLSRLKNNAGHDRFSLFVVENAEAARDVRAVLSDPPLVAAEDEYGRRTFYNGPDRIPLAGGGYAAIRTDTSPDDLVWRETGESDDHSLQLVDDGTVVTVLDSVADLGCPLAEAFPYSYRRDRDDKRFRVETRDGRVIGVYDGVADMRANAYVPLPMPLVPEHVFDGVASVRNEWAVLIADAEPETDSGNPPQIVTADSS